jgi:molybdopterin-guanine dinucleotide biosynthesis protein A
LIMPESGPERPGVPPDAVGFVLAGGKSSRMGQDKALVQLAGQSLAERALGILRGAGLAVSLAGGSPAIADLAPVVQDSVSGLGPLGGICAALASTSARLAVFMPIDLPLLPAPLIVYLLEHANVTGVGVTLTSIGGFAQTFPAVLDRGVLAVLESELQAGRRGCFAAFETAAARLGQRVSVIPVETLVQSCQVAHPESLAAERWFLNVNAPDGLRLANQHLSGPHRVS